MQRHILIALFTLLGLAAGCGQIRVGDSPPAGIPGFDTSRYPGDDALRAWLAPASPYRWVGFYLQSPCRRDTSWNGKRATIQSIGWGMAVLFVGQQAWEGAGLRGDSAATVPPPCSRALLTEARGRADADDAIARALAEGFASGTTIFLDIERMSAIPDSMRSYYRAWVRELWNDGRYRPGIYAHRLNAAQLYADIEAMRGTISSSSPPLRWWLAGGSDFTLGRVPADVGVTFANIWQGWHNVRERWNEVALDIDVNIADRPDPSAPR